MSISAVASQATGATTDNATSTSKAYPGNVTAGNLIVVVAGKYSPSDDAFAAGDCTKSAGTATLGTISLDSSVNYAYSGGAEHVAVGVWTAIVTGTGSLTMQVGGGAAGSYWVLGIDEYSSTLGWDASRVEAFSSGNATSGTPDSGNMTSAGAALFIGGVATVTTGATTHTPDGAFTQIYEEENGATHGTGSIIRRIVTTGTTDSVSWSAPNGPQWAAAGAVLKETAGGGGVVGPLLQGKLIGGGILQGRLIR